MIIFLDIDGVLNSGAWFDENPGALGDFPVGHLDPAAVARLERILTTTGARIVISSSWRHGGSPLLGPGGRRLGSDRERTYIAIEALLRERGAPSALVVGQTALFSGHTRAWQILCWLDEHFAVEKRPPFVVLDDDPKAYVCAHFVRISADVGLTDPDADDAIAVLTRPG